MRWFWDWAKYHNSHNSKNIRVTKLSFGRNDLPKSTYTILAKEQFGHSYTFWTMVIIIFSPVSNSSNHPLIIFFQTLSPFWKWMLLIILWNVIDADYNFWPHCVEKDDPGIGSGSDEKCDRFPNVWKLITSTISYPQWSWDMDQRK